MRVVFILIILCMINACKVKQPQASYNDKIVICGGVDDIFAKLPKPNKVFSYSIEDTNAVYLVIKTYNFIYNSSSPLPLTRVKIHTYTQLVLDTTFSYGYWSNKLYPDKYELEICSVYNDYCIKDTLELKAGSYNQLFVRFDFINKHHEKISYCDTMGFKNAILYNIDVVRRSPEWLR